MNNTPTRPAALPEQAQRSIEPSSTLLREPVQRETFTGEILRSYRLPVAFFFVLIGIALVIAGYQLMTWGGVR